MKDPPAVKILFTSIIKHVSIFQNIVKRRMNWERGEKKSKDF